MRRFAFLAGAVLFVVLGWTAAWFALAFTARNQIVALAGADGETVPRLSCERLDVSGFPFNFNFACDGMTALYQDVSIAVPSLHVAAPVMWPARALLSTRGAIAVSDAFTGSRAEMSYSALTATVRLDGLRLGRVSAVADDVTWTNANFGVLEAAAGHVEAHAVDIPSKHAPERGAAALALNFRADGATLPALAIADGSATLDGELTGIPDDVRRFGAPDALRSWQVAGGRLAVDALEVKAGERSLEAKSNLGLDSTGRVEGRIELSSLGVVDTAGLLLPEEIRRVVFGSPGADGRYRQTLNARAGIVMAGFLPVSVIPPLF